MPTLVIANKCYSSWSLRPWLLLKQLGIPFDEVLIPLDQPDTKAAILKHSPAGKVPILIEGDCRPYGSPSPSWTTSARPLRTRRCGRAT